MKYKHVVLGLAALCIFLAATNTFLFISLSGTDKIRTDVQFYKGLSEDLEGIIGNRGIHGQHIHADFRVVVNDKPVNFRRQGFDVANMLVHLHLTNSEMGGPAGDEGDKVIHIEATGITFGQFLNTLGMKLTPNCYKDNGKEYCKSETDKLELYVNGQKNLDLGDYELKPHDKILLIYGNYSSDELQKQIGLVTDFSKRFN